MITIIIIIIIIYLFGVLLFLFLLCDSTLFFFDGRPRLLRRSLTRNTFLSHEITLISRQVLYSGIRRGRQAGRQVCPASGRRRWTRICPLLFLRPIDKAHRVPILFYLFIYLYLYIYLSLCPSLNPPASSPLVRSFCVSAFFLSSFSFLSRFPLWSVPSFIFYQPVPWSRPVLSSTPNPTPFLDKGSTRHGSSSLPPGLHLYALWRNKGKKEEVATHNENNSFESSVSSSWSSLHSLVAEDSLSHFAHEHFYALHDREEFTEITANCCEEMNDCFSDLREEDENRPKRRLAYVECAEEVPLTCSPPTQLHHRRALLSGAADEEMERDNSAETVVRRLRSHDIERMEPAALHERMRSQYEQGGGEEEAAAPRSTATELHAEEGAESFPSASERSEDEDEEQPPVKPRTAPLTATEGSDANIADEESFGSADHLEKEMEEGGESFASASQMVDEEEQEPVSKARCAPLTAEEEQRAKKEEHESFGSADHLEKEMEEGGESFASASQMVDEEEQEPVSKARCAPLTAEEEQRAKKEEHESFGSADHLEKEMEEGGESFASASQMVDEEEQEPVSKARCAPLTAEEEQRAKKEEHESFGSADHLEKEMEEGGESFASASQMVDEEEQEPVSKARCAPLTAEEEQRAKKEEHESFGSADHLEKEMEEGGESFASASQMVDEEEQEPVSKARCAPLTATEEEEKVPRRGMEETESFASCYLLFSTDSGSGSSPEAEAEASPSTPPLTASEEEAKKVDPLRANEDARATVKDAESFVSVESLPEGATEEKGGKNPLGVAQEKQQEAVESDTTTSALSRQMTEEFHSATDQGEDEDAAAVEKKAGESSTSFATQTAAHETQEMVRADASERAEKEAGIKESPTLEAQVEEEEEKKKALEPATDTEAQVAEENQELITPSGFVKIHSPGFAGIRPTQNPYRDRAVADVEDGGSPQRSRPASTAVEAAAAPPPKPSQPTQGNVALCYPFCAWVGNLYTPQGLYTYYCKQYRVAPNASIVAQLEEGSQPFEDDDAETASIASSVTVENEPMVDPCSLRWVRRVHVPSVLLKDCGFLPLLETLRWCPALRDISVADNELSNEALEWMAHAILGEDNTALYNGALAALASSAGRAARPTRDEGGSMDVQGMLLEQFFSRYFGSDMGGKHSARAAGGGPSAASKATIPYAKAFAQLRKANFSRNRLSNGAILLCNKMSMARPKLKIDLTGIEQRRIRGKLLKTLERVKVKEGGEQEADDFADTLDITH
eukprot:gene12582-8621_t